VASLSVACATSALESSQSTQAWPAKIAQSLFAVLFPSDCRICGAPLIEISRLPVCRACVEMMLPISGGLCATCGERLFSPYAIGDAHHIPQCGLCRRSAPAFSKAVAYGSYEGGLRELIHLLKFGGGRPAANVLGRMLAEAITGLDSELPAGPVLVIPVPLHRSKLRQRGFNQAELMAAAAIKIKNSKDRLHLCTGALVRKRDTSSQIGLTSHQRRENLQGAFGMLRSEIVKGREIILVDDVYTTGATVSECARVLRRAGATRVWVATVARTLKIAAQHVQVRSGNGLVEGGSLEEAPEIPLARAAGG
jgi:ComF family protein